MPYEEKVLEKHREAMRLGEATLVTLTDHEEEKSEGTIRLIRLDAATRNKRASKWLISCLVIAPVTVLCPPHFFWVFVTVAVGFIGAHLRRGRKELVAGGEAKCPKCGAFQIIDKANAEFPMAHFCTECGERSLVRPVPSA